MISLAGAPWLIGAWLIAASCFLVGFRTRLSGAVLTVVVGYYLLAEGGFYSNHIYFLLLVVFLLTVADSGATLSVDWLLRGRPITEIAYGPVLLLKIQVTIVYFFAGVAKLNPAFLSGAVLPEMLSSFPDAWMSPELAITASWAATILEFYLVFALWNRGLRLSAILFGVIFHGLIVVTMSFYAGLITYSTTIVATYWLYLSDEEMAALLRRVAGFLGSDRERYGTASRRSLLRVVAEVTLVRGFVAIVAGHAGDHVGRFFLEDGFALSHWSMAFLTGDLDLFVVPLV